MPNADNESWLRVKERLRRPVIALARADERLLRGSAR